MRKGMENTTNTPKIRKIYLSDGQLDCKKNKIRLLDFQNTMQFLHLEKISPP
jgi:hypothetical protein